MLNARLIVNPAAGAGRTAKKWPKIRDLLKHIGLHFEHDLTEAPGHAIELAKTAAAKGYELIVSVGGDGTINEVVNGMYEAGSTQDVTLGIISTGTGSDYARTIGISPHQQEACQCLLHPRQTTVDLGVLEYTSNSHRTKRLFVNFAGLGFATEVVKATTQKFKFLGGMPSYLTGLLSTFLLYKNKEITLRLDGVEEKRNICTVMMNNGKYGGGSMLVAPDADLRDGLLDVLIIDALSKADLLCSLPRIYKGTHLTHPKVSLKKAKMIEIEAKQKMFLQADGELLGETPARAYVMPAALKIIT